MPYYPELKLSLPPVLEILEWADRQQFDAIHVSTPGPMGLCGWLVAKMLRVPMLATYHTDFPAYLEQLSGDHRNTNGSAKYMSWFYNQATTVFLRSAAYRFKMLDLHMSESKLSTILPAIDTHKFNPKHRDASIWSAMGVQAPRRLLYAGRVSVEKNLPMLVSIFRSICETRDDVALIVAGDGPFLETMRQQLCRLPVFFTGSQDDAELAGLYANSDLLIFPSRTDTLGQVVMEAQACGLPAIVSADGGPKETIADGHSGIVVQSSDPADWTRAVIDLLDDEPRRQRMSVDAASRASRLDQAESFDRFWADHLAAAEPEIQESGPILATRHIETQVSLPPRVSKDPADF